MSYVHLSLAERHYIELERKKGESMNAIAKILKRSHTTISRELSRNTSPRGYFNKEAQSKAIVRHRTKNKAIKLTDTLRERIRELLSQEWSPEQIAGWLKQEAILIHHETIYQYILSDKHAGGTLYQQLRHQGKRNRWRYGLASKRNKNKIPGRVDIAERPNLVNCRRRVGDWEADTIIGARQQGAIVTLDERKTKIRLAAPLPGKRSEPVKEAIVTLLKPIKQFVHTITFDNGREFFLHQKIAQHLDCKTYFAKPYHSWERGQNENANGLLRQYFPKTMALVNVLPASVVHAVHRLNNRPRKCLNYKTPYEAFKELTGFDISHLMGCALMT